MYVGGAAGLAALLPGGPLDIPELKGKRCVYTCIYIYT